MSELWLAAQAVAVVLLLLAAVGPPFGRYAAGWRIPSGPRPGEWMGRKTWTRSGAFRRARRLRRRYPHRAGEIVVWRFREGHEPWRGRPRRR